MSKFRKSQALAVSKSEPAKKLLKDLRSLIDVARKQASQVVNAGLVRLNWMVGERIRRDILKGKRAGYGDKIVSTLSRQLSAEYGKGYTEKSLRRMIQFAELFPDARIVATLSRQLGWSHFIELLPYNDPLQREFYAEMCRIERWSVRTLRQKTNSMLYERTGLSRKPAKLAKMELKALRDEDRLSPDLIFRDPYVLDFLGLQDTFSETDLESAILRKIERFLLELGDDFAFIARQKRMTIGSTDYHLDLLFYHRRLRALVALELKLGKFQPPDTGQMELYLRWLEKYEQRPGENPPLGVILCGNKNYEEVAMLRLDSKGIHVAEYLTEMPPRPLFEKKLHEAIELAQEELARRDGGI